MQLRCTRSTWLRRLAAADEATPAAPASPQGLAGFLAESGGLLRRQGKPLADRFRELTARYLQFQQQLLTPLLDQWRQFRVLTARYVELVWGDRRSFSLLFLQAPVVAFILLIGFWTMPFRGVVSPFDAYVGRDGALTDEGAKALGKWKMKVRLGDEDREISGIEAYDLYRHLPSAEVLSDSPDQAGQAAPVPVEVQYQGRPFTLTPKDQHRVRQDFERLNPRNTYTLLFMLVVVVMWFGCNNAAKEIVKEDAIYRRERAVNLGVLPYLASKFVVLSVITALHTLLLMGIVFGALELRGRLMPGYSGPPPDFRLDYATMFGIFALLAMQPASPSACCCRRASRLRIGPTLCCPTY